MRFLGYLWIFVFHSARIVRGGQSLFCLEWKIWRYCSRARNQTQAWPSQCLASPIVPDCLWGQSLKTLSTPIPRDLIYNSSGLMGVSIIIQVLNFLSSFSHMFHCHGAMRFSVVLLRKQGSQTDKCVACGCGRAERGLAQRVWAPTGLLPGAPERPLERAINGS